MKPTRKTKPLLCQPPLRQLLMALAGVLFLTALSGCASLGSGSDVQAVFIQTHPSGATVVVDGENVLEAEKKTPSYVVVKRSHSPAVTVQLDNAKKTIELDTDYRWRKSFWPNFVFLVYAPVGWIIDLALGTAWDPVDPPEIRLNAATPPRTADSPSKPKTFAIAPPRANSLALSETAAEALERQLIASNRQLARYEKTLPTFLSFGADYDSDPTPSDWRMIAYRLGVDAIYESTIVEANGQLSLEAKARDVITKDSTDPIELVFEPKNEAEKIWSGVGVSFVRGFPNTLGIDISEQKLGFLLEGATSTQITLSPVSEGAFHEAPFRNLAQYASAISISNLPVRRSGRSSRAVLTLTPNARLSRRVFQVDGLPALAEQRFLRWAIAAGYGPEFGYQAGRHYFYINLIPHLYWSEISWERNKQEFSETNVNLSFEAELGYLFFIGHHWSARLYARSMSEDSKGWERALSSTTNEPDTFREGSATLNTTGITVNYTFDSLLISDQSWTRKKAK